MASGRLCLFFFGSLLASGCGGNSIKTLPAEGENEGGGGGSGVGGEAAHAGNSMSGRGGNGGATMAGGASGLDTTPAGFPRCGVLDPARANDCAGIDEIRPSELDVSSNIDGSIRNGEFATVHVFVLNGDDIAHEGVCLGVVVDDPGITLTPTEDYGMSPARIGRLGPGSFFEYHPVYFYVEDVEPDTVARFTAWTTFEGTDCTGPTATVETLVKIGF